MRKIIPGICLAMMAILGSNVVWAQDACNLTFRGKVINGQSHENMPFATVVVDSTTKGVVSDKDGNFKITGLCPGTYTFSCSFIGYKTVTYRASLSANRTHNFTLMPANTSLNEVNVIKRRRDDPPMISQIKTDVKGAQLLQERGNSLGESLKSVAGVTTFQTGPSIFKPVIHGLHSNRILILNNGVRQEGQQWGSEHAPEIDPFVATKLTVVEGASSIRYGSDAIGGVILVEPAPMPTKPGISGEANIVGATNNRMGVVSGILQQAFGNKLQGLSWRLQGTYRRAGNSRTPHYYMENTGFKEADFSTALAYHKENYGMQFYYSQFNTKLGIFSGSHAESISDFQAAINRAEPITPSYFSYDINRPYQQVRHDLVKVDGYYQFNDRDRLDIIFARQRDIRQEFDYASLSGRTNPELYLKLVSHTLDISYNYGDGRKFSGTIGANGITQGNVRKYEMLIPNFRNYSGGAYTIGRWTNNNLTLEGGIRYDYTWLRVYMIDTNTAREVTPTYHFNNVTGSIGSQYHILPGLSWNINLGTAWRAPNVNELYSHGVHQSAVAYDIGNPDLHLEREYSASTSLHYSSQKLEAEVGLYDNLINGYIFLKPDLEYIHTVRGSYPKYTYTQVDANFKGIDVSGTWKIVKPLSYITKVSLLYAYNKTIHDYLQQIPSNRFENTLKYRFNDFGAVKKPYLSVTDLYVAKQNRVPPNSDYLAPPGAYMLVNAEAGCALKMGKQVINLSLSCANIFNLAYRDYMDRFRYFADEPGRNFMIKANIPFGKSN